MELSFSLLVRLINRHYDSTSLEFLVQRHLSIDPTITRSICNVLGNVTNSLSNKSTLIAETQGAESFARTTNMRELTRHLFAICLLYENGAEAMTNSLRLISDLNQPDFVEDILEGDKILGIQFGLHDAGKTSYMADI